MRRKGWLLMVASILCAAPGLAGAQDVLRLFLPQVLGGNRSSDDDEDAKNPAVSAAEGLAVGLGAIAVGTVGASVLANQTTIGVRQRGAPAADKATSSIRSFTLGGAAAPMVRFVRWNIETMAKQQPALWPAGIGLLEDLGLATAAESGTADDSVTQADRLTWDTLLPDCRNKPPRPVAQTSAYAWAGVAGNFADFAQIPWRNFIFPSGMNKNSRAFGEFRAAYWAENFYELNSGGAYVREHPLGHPDQPGQDHHECPHFHAVNKFKAEKIFEYMPQ